MELEKELDFSYNLIKKTFSVNFTKPEMVTGDENISKFIKISGLNDLARSYSIQMVYDGRTNTFFVQDWLLEDEKYRRLYGFTHELAHSLMCQLNSLSFQDRPDESVKDDKREEAETLTAFSEGMADYITIESCKNSRNHGLIKITNERENDLKDGLKAWTDKEDRNIRLMAKVYNIDPLDWKRIIIRYLQRNDGAIYYHAYYLGYNFVSTLRPQNIVDVIKNPPRSFKELLYPEIYTKRLKNRVND